MGDLHLLVSTHAGRTNNETRRLAPGFVVPGTSQDCLLVEVGGVEPPSENLSARASTCVADFLISPPRKPVGMALNGQPVGFRPTDPGPGPAGLAYLYDVLVSPGRRGKEDVAAS